ncbi:hypothetical protein TNCV_1229181 [Trichonephila clavipes]|nr:hypothetical protein TNCV_1229181 [Trichonephila clavipes]
MTKDLINRHHVSNPPKKFENRNKDIGYYFYLQYPYGRSEGQEKQQRTSLTHTTSPALAKNSKDRLLDLPFDLYQRISATNRVPTFTVPLTNHNSAAIQTIQDFSAETVFKKNSDSVATPSCHVRPTNQDTLSQAGPPTSGHIHYLDMGWRNASRSVSQ